MSVFDDRKCAGEDPELFYPLDSEKAQITLAKSVCKGCPAAIACLEMALDSESERGVGRHGIFGGLTARQRGDLWRKRQKETAA